MSQAGTGEFGVVEVEGSQGGAVGEAGEVLVLNRRALGEIDAGEEQRASLRRVGQAERRPTTIIEKWWAGASAGPTLPITQFEELAGRGRLLERAENLCQNFTLT